MAKKSARKKSVTVPTEPMLIALGAASIFRDKTYDVMAQVLEETKWIGKSRKDMQKKLLAAGEKEYARMLRDVEKSLDVAMKRAEKPLKKSAVKKPKKKPARRKKK